MRNRIVAAVLLLFAAGWGAFAQQPTSEARVALNEQPVISDAAGASIIAARLRETAPVGSLEAPLRNLRLTLENRSSTFFTHVSGWATFYDANGVRCGEGIFQVDAMAPGELAETDLPGLRLTCTPASWRLAAKNLLTRTTNAARPTDQPSPPVVTNVSTAAQLPPLKININGEVLPVQPGNPIEVKVGRETVRILLEVTSRSDK